MSRKSTFIVVLAVAATLAFAVGVAAQSATAVTQQSGTVIAKGDGKVVVRMDDGTTREFTPAPGRTILVDGVPTGYADLKVGTVLKADYVSTTKSVPVQTIEIKNAEVVKVYPNSLVVRNADGYVTHVIPDDFRFLVNGEETSLSSIKPGMLLTATIVSTKTTTQTAAEYRNVGGAGPAAAPAPVAAAAPAAAPAPAAAATMASAETPPAATETRELPKTASPIPAAALTGALSLLAGLALRASRRRR